MAKRPARVMPGKSRAVRDAMLGWTTACCSERPRPTLALVPAYQAGMLSVSASIRSASLQDLHGLKSRGVDRLLDLFA